MAHGDPIEILIRHDQWATGLMLDACRDLTDEQLDREFEMGLGTLRKTLTHNLGAMRGWSDMLAQRDWQPRVEEQPPMSIDEIRTLHKEIADDFASLVRSHPVDEVVSADRGGKVYAFTRGQILTHVYTHSVHHRAQALNMMRHLGADGETPSSIMLWALMADPAG